MISVDAPEPGLDEQLVHAVGVKVTATQHFAPDDRVSHSEVGSGAVVGEAAGRPGRDSGCGRRRIRPRFVRRRAGRRFVGLVAVAADHGHNDHGDHGRDQQPCLPRQSPNHVQTSESAPLVVVRPLPLALDGIDI